MSLEPACMFITGDTEIELQQDRVLSNQVWFESYDAAPLQAIHFLLYIESGTHRIHIIMEVLIVKCQGAWKKIKKGRGI